MTNPKITKSLEWEPPTPAQIKAARKAAGLSQTKAAELIYKKINAWQKWEAGDRKMDAAFFELFNIKVEELKVKK